MAKAKETYPASFDVDYPGQLDRFTTFVRLVWVIPVAAILSLLSGAGSGGYTAGAGKTHSVNWGWDIMSALFAATALMIVFRQRYPRWWFDFALEFNRFSARVGAYLFLLTDKYPSTTERQSVRLNIAYPDVPRDLNRWLPLVKWLLAIPHYVVLAFLVLGAVAATIAAWFVILFTGKYPRSLFDFVVGVGRWSTRLNAYAFLLTTDKYPPFSLK